LRTLGLAEPAPVVPGRWMGLASATVLVATGAVIAWLLAR
jgi:hypothetical protein